MSDLSVTLLGTGTPNPTPERAGASYLFQAGGFRFMIDCGPGALLRLGQAGSSAAEIDHIFFTHFHLDHWADFGPFIVNRWIRGNRRPLNAYGPAGQWHSDRPGALAILFCGRQRSDFTT